MKTITMMDLRKGPGKYEHLVSEHGESFTVTKQGKPVFKMEPLDDMIVVKPDGTVIGKMPVTFRQDLGDKY